MLAYKKYIWKFILTLFLTINTIVSQAQIGGLGNDYIFSYITVEEGLPNNFIDDIYKDNFGFMWFATNGGGLVRYDGYDFKQFTVTSKQVNLKSNFVKKICEDNFHRLWVSTEAGIDIINLVNLNENLILPFNEKIQKIFASTSISNYKDRRGSIWLSFQTKEIVKIDFDPQGQISNIRILETPPECNTAVLEFCEFGDQMIVAYSNTVYTVQNGDDGKLTVSKFKNCEKLNCTTIMSLLENNNELWIGTDKGLFRYNPINQNIKAYYNNPADKNSISQNFICDLKSTPDRGLVAATLKGLNFYNPVEDNFFVVQESETIGKFKTINNNFINCLLCDNKTLWIGTETGGVNKLITMPLKINNYTHNETDPNTISKGPINSVFQDKQGNIWIGCIEGGLNLKKSETNNFRHFSTADGLSHNSVSDIAQGNDPNILVLATWGNGITFFDKKNYKAIGYLNTENTGHSIDFIGAIVTDTINNGIWIGSNRGIFFYDYNTQKTTSPIAPQITENINGCLGTLIDQKGILWIGTNVGIIKINLNSFKQSRTNFDVEKLEPEKNKPLTMFRTKITSFLQANDGTIYIGTDGYGLVKTTDQTQQDQTQIYNTDDGLCNNVVAQIEEDNNHNIWLATCHGISCFKPANNRFTNYYQQNGLCCNQFFWNGFKKLSNGKLLFGSINGLIEIDPQYNTSGIYSTPNQVTLTELSVDDKIVNPGSGIIDANIMCAKEIKLHERNKSFTIEFSSLNNNSSSSEVYQYRLIGFNHDKWTTVSSSRRFAQYTNLSRGNYTFQVRCAQGADDFSDITEIKITVSPYFYKSWWFILLTIITIIVAVYYAERWRTKILRRRTEMLEQKVELRTAALKSQKEELTNRNTQLSIKNQEILNQKNQLEQMSKKVQDLTIDKLAFFTNITHEFRTPVTLIIGPIERALKLSTNPKVIEQLTFVDKNSKHLLSLVNQLLDFRKVESDNMPINYTAGNFAIFIDDITLPFRALAKAKNIQLCSLNRLAEPYLNFDREAMTKIITNLLGNAIKFTPEGGIIKFYTTTLKNPDRIYICISDTGKGIVDEDIDKIFNRFYQSHSQQDVSISGQSGTGIGLYLCKRLTQLLNGTITAKNNKTIGASFRLQIPFTKVENIPSEQQHIAENETETEEQDEQQNPHRLKILIVEDNPDMRGYIRSVLTEDYFVEEAGGGKEALQKLKSTAIDFVISDLMMPEMDGLQLVKAIKKDFNISHIPFLMLSAKTSKEAQLESLYAGADDYITKPFDETMLKAKIASMLANRQRFQQRFANEMLVENLNITEDSSDKKFIDKAIETVKANYQNSYYEVSDFVEAMGVSKSLLNKKMQTLTGQSAGQFIRNYRLQVAKELILKNRITKNMNISEIAYEVGFNDPKYFTRCFTKHYNVTPSSMLDGGNTPTTNINSNE